MLRFCFDSTYHLWQQNFPFEPLADVAHDAIIEATPDADIFSMQHLSGMRMRFEGLVSLAVSCLTSLEALRSNKQKAAGLDSVET